MKKKIIYLMLILFLAIMPATVYGASLTAIVSAITKVYDEIPDAQYSVMIYQKGQSKILNFDSASNALGAKDIALYEGAEMVDIRSAWPTVHNECDDKRYYKDGRVEDI